jgi:hypothetical protein
MISSKENRLWLDARHKLGMDYHQFCMELGVEIAYDWTFPEGLADFLQLLVDSPHRKTLLKMYQIKKGIEP